MKKLLKILATILVASLILFLISYFLKDKLPSSQQINSSLFQEPIQEKIEIEPIAKEFKGVKYQINPQYSYGLWGLVVSENDNEVWYSRFKNTDPLNTKDFCVIWGENVKNNNYQKIKFKTEEFVCLFSYRGNIKFNGQKLSNNHLLPANDEIYRKIREASIGDQIHFKGYLSSYKATDKKGQELTRGTSNTRTDTGGGACETVYVEDFEVIKSGNVFLRFVYLFAKYLFILSLLLLIFLFLFEFFKPEEKIVNETGFAERNKKYKDLLPPSVGRDL